MAFQSHLQSTPLHRENSYQIADYTTEVMAVLPSTAAKPQEKPVAASRPYSPVPPGLNSVHATEEEPDQQWSKT